MEESQIISMLLSTEPFKKIQEKTFSKFSSIFENLNFHTEAREKISQLAPLVHERELELTKKIENKYLKFRTLLSRDADVHISEIYQPLQIKNRQSNYTIEIDEKCKLDLPRISCIIGKAGQGKTTLLKKIFLNSITNQDGVFPLIITLRNIDYVRDCDLVSVIVKEICSLGLDICPEACLHLLSMKRLRLLFDGFDEVPDEYAKTALKTIEYAYYSLGLDVIVTSRPNTEITYTPGISNFDLLDLDVNDVNRIIIEHPSIPNKDKDIFIRVISEKKYISEILVTPILVDIFCSTYNSLTTEPKNLIDFYNQLFQSLASTHDRLKTFYERSSKSGLDNYELERIIHAASFKLLSSKNDITFDSDFLVSTFKDACSKLNFDAKNTHIDIIDKTSLIKDEGQTHSFLHKSIIEFFSAKYIANLPEETRESFYEYIINSRNSRYENVLKFLHKIDKNCFYLYFAKKILKEVEQSDVINIIKDNETITPSIARYIIGVDHVETQKTSINHSIRTSLVHLVENENISISEGKDEKNRTAFHLIRILFEAIEFDTDSETLKQIAESISVEFSELVFHNNDILKSICLKIGHRIEITKDSNDIPLYQQNCSYYRCEVFKLLNLNQNTHLRNVILNICDSMHHHILEVNETIRSVEVKHKKLQTFDF
ncbi:NACHT domain-containing protein [Shewanella sp. 3B26]|uniref:NACHT domain-containing protein n=1 Tax=Shewanella zhuhaiensis TaxID=2919576 RepID=A0AAJ1BGB5_9GAMM|nr:NACHT domain-containing protein [Shewanella zhuhaiensis]MCH4294233.1 NACHT domain-containing protein [Shewanella zhuhaiensis]